MAYSSKEIARAYAPVSMVLIATIWAVHYVWTTLATADQDETALALIGPMLFLIIPLAGLTIVQIILQTLRRELQETSGLLDTRRITYLIALSAFVIFLPILGFVPTSILFFLSLSWRLGMRQLPVLAGVAGLLFLIILGGFSSLLRINLPLWPVFGF